MRLESVLSHKKVELWTTPGPGRLHQTGAGEDSVCSGKEDDFFFALQNLHALSPQHTGVGGEGPDQPIKVSPRSPQKSLSPASNCGTCRLRWTGSTGRRRTPPGVIELVCVQGRGSSFPL